MFPISTASNISQHEILFIMADGRVVETENLKKVLEAISKIKKKKEGQCEEKIIQLCVEEFDLKKKKYWLV